MEKRGFSLCLCIFLCIQVTQWTFAHIISVNAVTKPSIHCGGNENSTVNITYPGLVDQIFVMYPVDHFFECSSQILPNFDHVIYNVKHRNCGMVFDKQMGTWTVDILLQKQESVITGLEPIFRLTCAYKRTTSGFEETNVTFTYNDTIQFQDNKEKITIIDTADVKSLVKDQLIDALKGSHVMTLRALDVDYRPTHSLYTGKSIVLALEFHSVIASLYNPPVVTQCVVSDNKNQSITSFHDHFLTGGCITHTGSLGFTANDVIEESSYRSYTQELVVPSSWTKSDEVVFECHVIICQRELSCRSTCPVDMVKLDENPDKTIRSEVKSSVLLTSLGDSFQTSAVAGSWLTLHWPYLLIIGVLILVLVIFAILLVLVLRVDGRCKKCHPCHDHQTNHHRGTPRRKNRPDSRLSAFSPGDSGIDDPLISCTRNNFIRTTPATSPESQKTTGPFPMAMIHSSQASGGSKTAGPFAQRIPVYARIPIAVPPRFLSQEMIDNQNTNKEPLGSDQRSSCLNRSDIPVPPPLFRSRRESVDNKIFGTGKVRINVPAVPRQLPGDVVRQPLRTQSASQTEHGDDKKVMAGIPGRYYI